MDAELENLLPGRGRRSAWSEPSEAPEPPAVFGLYVGIDEYPWLQFDHGGGEAEALSRAFTPISRASITLVDRDATRDAILEGLEDLIDRATAFALADPEGSGSPLIVVSVSAVATLAHDTCFILTSDSDFERPLSTGFPFSFVTRSLASLDIPSLIIADVSNAAMLAIESFTTSRGASQGLIMATATEEQAVDGRFTPALARTLEAAIAGDEAQGTTLYDAFDAARDAVLEAGMPTPVFYGTLDGNLSLRVEPSPERPSHPDDGAASAPEHP